MVISDGPMSHVKPASRRRAARPPGASHWSMTVTARPCAWRRSAQASPPRPAPMTTARGWWVGGAAGAARSMLGGLRTGRTARFTDGPRPDIAPVRGRSAGQAVSPAGPSGRTQAMGFHDAAAVDRKADHLAIAAEDGVLHQVGAGLQGLRLRHRALPGRDLDTVGLEAELLGR